MCEELRGRIRKSKIILIQLAQVCHKLIISLSILSYQSEILKDLICSPTSSKSYNHTLLTLMDPFAMQQTIRICLHYYNVKTTDPYFNHCNALCNTPIGTVH